VTASGRTCRSVVAIALALSSAVTASAQTADVPITYSTTALTRNADLMLTAAILATAATDAGLEAVSPSLARGSRPGGRAVRAAKLMLFDFPVVMYFTSLNHEWGHQAGAREFGVESKLHFEGWPWSSKPFGLETSTDLPDRPPAAAVAHGGGLEASRRLKDRSEWRMARTSHIAPGQALANIIASLDTPVYAFGDLAADRFRNDHLGDVVTLVGDLARRRLIFDRPGLDRLRHDVRTRAALNLLDAALWSETYGLVLDHVWNGEDSVRVRWLKVGGAEVLPSVRYELSPFGPEYYLGSYFKAFGTTGRAYGRWTERIGSERMAGGGISLLLPAIAGPFRSSNRGRIPLTIDVDSWSHTTDGLGMHASVGADVVGWPRERAALTMTIGAKSSSTAART
jgi:hypothetical protein